MLRFAGILAKNYILTVIDVAAVATAVITVSHVIARATGWKRERDGA